MIRQDYLLRIIEQLATYLAQLLHSKEELTPEHARDSLDSTSLRYLGLGYEIVEFLDEEELRQLLYEGPEISLEKAVVAGTLLAKHADLLDRIGLPTDAKPRRVKALAFLLDAYESLRGKVRDDLGKQIRQQQAKLDPSHLGPDLEARLAELNEPGPSR